MTDDLVDYLIFLQAGGHTHITERELARITCEGCDDPLSVHKLTSTVKRDHEEQACRVVQITALIRALRPGW